jgi:uncharacterized protein
MKKELLAILVCPVCKGKLELTIERQDKVEIIDGTLYCRKCDHKYPIVGTIPNLLPPEKVG